MLFNKNEQLPLIVCDTCKGSGYLHTRKCTACQKMSFGFLHNGKFAYFGKPLTQYYISVKQGERTLEKVRFLTAFAGFLFFLLLFLWQVNAKDYYDEILTERFWTLGTGVPAYFWLSFFFLGYIIYRFIMDGRTFEGIHYEKEKKKTEAIMVRDWEDVFKLEKNEKFDFSSVFTKEADQVIEEAYLLAEKYNHEQVTPVHIFYSLLSSRKVRNVFIRLGLPGKDIQGIIEKSFPKPEKKVIPVLSVDALQILAHSYKLAYEAKAMYVHVTELLLATVGQSELLQDFLYDLKVEQNKLNNVVEWLRIQDRLSVEYRDMVRRGSTRNKHGLDRAMTAVATPYLNNFSSDLTYLAQIGNLEACVGRDKEIDEIFRVVEGGRQNVILVGERGVGKRSIIYGLAQKMVEERVPARLKDKRLMQLSVSSLLAGTTVSGAQERLQRIMNEVARARNIILFVQNLNDLVSMGNGQEGFDVAQSLAEHLRNGRFFMFATSIDEGYNRYIVNSEIGKQFSKIAISEMTENQAIQVLEAKTAYTEYKQDVFFSYASLETAVSFAKRYLHDQRLPESALSLMSEAGSYARAKRGENTFVTKNDVGEVIGEKTGIPATGITEDESQKLLRLEEEMHKRVVGQKRAVELVASALRRSRAEVRSTNRPIANFLFLGPTGVGKTELAKTIADVYFGAEERMIRVDMSEYQDKMSIYRLIGQAGQQGTGILTEAVRQQPFSLILLDELEKADPDVLNIFLQVFDDGHLTDSVGRKIDFTNTIIIATSNAGTQYVISEVQKGTDMDAIEQDIIHGELQKYYKPEFLNRFDGIVLFKALDKIEIREIAKLMLKKVEKNLLEKGIFFRAEEEGIDKLVEAGFNPSFGARPMRRAVQDIVENELANKLLRGEIERKDTVVFGREMYIEKSR
ncbi:MAG: ATP-dependent Clp protease ATP-binding subunit [Candidatus Magasanikbacteria bacterium]